MGKAESIDAILEQAIKAFAEWGFEGASLRQIAAEARVPLATIHAYFGSKRNLYIAAMTAVWDEIAVERDASIKRALAANPGQPVSLYDVLTAMVLPIVRRAMSDSDVIRYHLYFVRGRIREHVAISGVDAMQTVNQSALRWINAVAGACPTLSRQDVIWVFSYCAGVMYSMQVMDRRYDSLIGDDTERTPEGITRDIVTFCCAGVQAIAEQRALENPPQ